MNDDFFYTIHKVNVNGTGNSISIIKLTYPVNFSYI